ncbi:tRNA adenosine(34) deaminase TadA [Legionella sp. W05-934-2]|jgi:tRNA(adenine34) deaminase|uniref:tRNA adenosine(34) deaminase TadA n=1 Tax=Legionella sp. W05-934-2 TaxID=1198649 RepID=UPI0034619D0D
MNDITYMKRALALANEAASLGEIPVGAVMVDASGSIIGEGYNQTISHSDPTAHAEIVALRKACLSINNHRLLDATLYVTLEPCPMCAGALIQSRIKRLVFSCRDFKSGACGSVVNIVNGLASNHAICLDEGLLADQSSRLLTQFFDSKR